MKVRSRLACISAAVAAFVYGGATAGAAEPHWDVDPGTAGVQDGSGNWETATANWFDGVNNVTWNNATPDSAFLGNDTNVFVGGTPNNIDMGAAITVQNLVLGTGADGQIYNISDFGGSLTLAGNVTKTSSGGNPQLLLINNGLTLAAGDHVFALRDTGGDAAAELTVNATISGAGGVTMNNGAYEAWGTLAFNPAEGTTPIPARPTSVMGGW
jgi:hypothetical protein